MMHAGADDRSLGALFADLAEQTGALVRGELAMAKAELTQTSTQVAKDAGIVVIGGLVAYAGLLAILAAAVLALAMALPGWLAGLIVGLTVLLLGAVTIRLGRAALGRLSLAPRQTMATLAADVGMVKGDRG